MRSGLDRNQVFLTTKIKSDEHGTHAAKEALHDSLSKTSLDYWDLVLLHDPKAGKKKRIEAYAVLFEAQKAGQIREIGVSNFGVKHLEELRAEKLPSPGRFLTVRKVAFIIDASCIPSRCIKLWIRLNCIRGVSRRR